MLRKMTAALENADIHVGALHCMEPAVVDGMAGIMVSVTWLEENKEVSARLLWIPPGTIDLLVEVCREVTSPEFAAEMEKIGGLREAWERG